MKNYFENIENNKSNLENYFQEILSEIQNMNERNLNVKINDDISNKLIEKMESIKEEIIKYHNIEYLKKNLNFKKMDDDYKEEKKKFQRKTNL